jgi:branched-subunit amino acid ABC-type transport system permease component
MSRVKNNKSHSRKNVLLYPINYLIGNTVVRSVTPPNKNVGICENLIKGAGWTTFSDAFTFVLLIVILMVKPTGLFGEKNIDKV